MTTRPLRLVPLGLLPLAVMAAFAGGWATITVEDLPDYVVAREPVHLTFTVRQHGVTPLGGLQPTIEATAGRLAARAEATPAAPTGRYIAVLTLPQPGEWTITIHSGFGNSRIRLLPVQAIEAGAGATVRLPDVERGRRLFVAKGCVACHLHRDVNETNTSVGPELTGRRYPPEYLQQFLANPAMKSSRGTGRMPNLNLKPPEIAALVAFINAERQALR